MVFVGHRLPALAQEAATAPPKTGVVSDSVPVTPATVDDALLSRILGTIALILLVYASVGVIILTIQQIVLKRNDVQHRAWVKARINGDPYPKDPWSPEVDTWFPPKSSAAYTGNKVGVNRQQRRIENKLKEKQKKDQLKKEKRASARSSSKKSDDNKEK